MGIPLVMNRMEDEWIQNPTALLGGDISAVPF